MVLAENIKDIHKRIKEAIKEKNKKVKQQVNALRKDDPQLKKGDKVYLLIKNIKSKRPSKKLDHVKVGLFLIIEERGPVNYKLDLSKDSKQHPIFHISLLEPADPSTPLQQNFQYEIKEEDEYKVKKILNQYGQKYLIK